LALVGLYPDGHIEVCHVPEGKDVEDAECRSTKRPEGERLYYIISSWYSYMGAKMRGLQTTETEGGK